MVDTQTFSWPVGFGLSALELDELDDSSHSLDMKPLSTLDYTTISGVEYEPSPPPSEMPHMMDLTHMYYRTQDSYRVQESIYRAHENTYRGHDGNYRAQENSYPAEESNYRSQDAQSMHFTLTFTTSQARFKV